MAKAEFEAHRSQLIAGFGEDVSSAPFALSLAEAYDDYHALIDWCERSGHVANLERYKSKVRKRTKENKSERCLV